MNPGAKLAAFAVVLVAAGGGGAAVGNVVGPIDTDDRPASHDTHDDTNDAGGEQEKLTMPGGLMISEQGYTLDTDETILTPGSPGPFTFRITGPDGSVVTDFVEQHERELHMIVVGADLGTYAHLHPERDADGTWSVALPDLAPGSYRAFADFAVADGPELTLGVDLSVPGETAVAALPEVSATSLVDGYEVTIEGAPAAGQAIEVAITVTKDGQPVTDLEPYLGAFGHLVAIRGGDLAYLHVHPMDHGGHGELGGPTVRFAVEVPSTGDYRFFFDFSHGGTVRTAAFTVGVGG